MDSEFRSSDDEPGDSDEPQAVEGRGPVRIATAFVALAVAAAFVGQMLLGHCPVP